MTVLVTTHLLDEAQRADRIAIMHNGNLAALDTPVALQAAVGGDAITIRTSDPATLAADIERQLNATAKVVDGSVRLEQANGHQWIARLVEAFPDRIESITLGKPTLEDVFIHFTGHRFWSDPQPENETGGRKKRKRALVLGCKVSGDFKYSMATELRSNSTTVPPWPVVGHACASASSCDSSARRTACSARWAADHFLAAVRRWLGQREGSGQMHLDYAHFFPGTLVMILLFTAIFATISIIEDRREGFLQGVLVAPIPRWSMVLGKVLGGTAIAMLQGIVFLFLGWIAGKLGWFEVISPTPLASSPRCC